MSCNGKYEIGWSDDTPDICANAVPTDFEKVENCRVIHINNGFYRGSIINGIFELVIKDKEKDYLMFSKKGDRVKVICYWFCKRPKTTFPQFLIQSAQIKIEENYTGEVIRNLGRK